MVALTPNAKPAPQSSTTRKHTVVVVDARPADYADLVASLPASKTELHFLTSGRAAMRFAATQNADAWVINCQLPDMRGSALCQMLQQTLGQKLAGRTILLIGDEYQAADELEARRTAGHTYVCKPLSASWVAPPKKSTGRELAPTRRTIDRRHADRLRGIIPRV